MSLNESLRAFKLDLNGENSWEKTFAMNATIAHYFIIIEKINNVSERIKLIGPWWTSLQHSSF